jgi:Lrp/AsnC family leucine-responsive transcriptional regulator
MKHQLDHIDDQIIKLLHENARTPLKVIASKVFLSSPAVSARIERLEEAGIITGYTAIINPAELGYHIKAFINLEVNPDQKKEFYPDIQSCNNVVECNCVTGEYAMLIKVMFKTTEELDHFISDLQRFGSTKTQIVFSTSVEHRGIPVISE